MKRTYRSIWSRRDGQVRNFRAVSHGCGRVGIEAFGGYARKPQKYHPMRWETMTQYTYRCNPWRLTSRSRVLSPLSNYLYPLHAAWGPWGFCSLYRKLYSLYCVFVVCSPVPTLEHAREIVGDYNCVFVSTIITKVLAYEVHGFVRQECTSKADWTYIHNRSLIRCGIIGDCKRFYFTYAQGGPTGFNTGNRSIPYAVWEML